MFFKKAPKGLVIKGAHSTGNYLSCCISVIIKYEMFDIELQKFTS